MDKISTDLFSDENNSKNNEFTNYNNFSISMLSPIINNANKKIDNKMEIIEIRNNIRKQKINSYNNIYEMCFRMIHNKSINGGTDLIYEIPLEDANCKYYSVDECYDYIENKFMNLNFNIKRINYNVIFVSWYFIET